MRKLLALVLVVALAACASPDLDSPEGTTEEFFNRLEAQDEDQVQELLCSEFHKNLNFALTKGAKAELKFDLHYDIPDDYDEETADTVQVEVWGTVKSKLENNDIQVEHKEKREQDAAWIVVVFKEAGEWKVCGGTEAPLILRFLDLRGQIDALK